MRLFSLYSWVRRRHLLATRGAQFMDAPWAGGVVLLVCVVVAMLLANIPATGVYYRHLLETNLSLEIVSPNGIIDWVFPRDMTVEKLINDGLMVIFFFAVGLEIKRELVCGQLSNVRQAILPVLAAAGGMLVPAVIFTLFNYGTGAANGWGIPTATDIAFAVGILSILGNRVPVSLKIFLTALAIADDLGAILVIALFYGESVQIGCLLIAIAMMIGVYIMKRMGETRMICYLVPAVIVWSLFYYSGVHSTISGVAMAMLIPMKPRYSKEYFAQKMRRLHGALLCAKCSGADFPNETHRYYLRNMESLASNSVGLSYRLEHALTPYVTFLVMPIFALANAGVPIASVEYLNIFHYSPELGSVGMGVFFGLVIGKPLGIFLASWLAVKSKLAVMPSGASWRMLFAVACLGGIGFTMSIFVDSLAYTDLQIIDRGKIAILMGSTAAALLGTLLILIFPKNKTNVSEK
ncbi:MAG: Na+/H+ antiporter NhaA [Alistipes sp.]